MIDHFDIEDMLGRVKLFCKLSKDKEIAAMLGLSPPDFSNRKKRGKLIEPILRWGIKQNVDLNWLMTGIRAQSSDKTTQECEHEPSGHPESGVIELHHIDVVKLFKNKSLAKEINEILLEIEEVDREHLREVKGLLRSELSRVKEKRIQKKTTANGE